MRRQTLFATAALLTLSAPAHSAQPALGLPSLPVGALTGALTPLVSGLAPLTALPLLDGLAGGVLPGLALDALLPVAQPLLQGLPPLPPLAGLEGVVPGVLSTVVLPTAVPLVTGLAGGH